MSPNVNRQTYKLPEPLASSVKANLADWRTTGKAATPVESRRLTCGRGLMKPIGWAGSTLPKIRSRTSTGFAPPPRTRKAVVSATFFCWAWVDPACARKFSTRLSDAIAGFPQLHVLDSTDPAQIKAFEGKVDLAKALFVVSSKSGSTLEPNIFKQYFFERVKQTIGADKAGSRFIAITDPGSKMQQVAEADRFRHIFFGLPSIGGRYSALSNFGMVPAALMGLDVARFLDRTKEMVDACAASVAVEENPGALLGIILGTAATSGRDKVTIIASPGISDLGAWLEQLLAESTGKQGKGIIPVDREELGAPAVYGNDRVFAYLRLDSAPDAQQDAKVAALEQAGHPVVRISLADVYDLGQEFFRWEIATAVAGSIIGINAFNQPDVEASKIATRELTSAYEKTGSLPAGIAGFGRWRHQALYRSEERRRTGRSCRQRQISGRLSARASQSPAAQAIILLCSAFIADESPLTKRSLQEMRHAVRDRKHVATCLGFGPRFLHSTGQAYKGGPNSGSVSAGHLRRRCRSCPCPARSTPSAS